MSPQSNAPAKANQQLPATKELLNRLADVKLQFGDETLYAHTSQLADHSTVLFDLFASTPKESWSDGVQEAVNDFSVKDVEMYLALHRKNSNIVSVREKYDADGDLRGLIKLADKLDAKEIVEELETHLLNNIDSYFENFGCAEALVEPIVYTWSLPNFSTVGDSESDTIKAFGHTWRLECQRKENNTMLGLYLKIASTASERPQPVCADWSTTLINQKDSEKSVSKDYCHVFKDNHEDWGHTSFAALSTINDPAPGFLVDDTLKIKVELKAFRDQNGHLVDWIEFSDAHGLEKFKKQAEEKLVLNLLKYNSKTSFYDNLPKMSERTLRRISGAVYSAWVEAKSRSETRPSAKEVFQQAAQADKIAGYLKND